MEPCPSRTLLGLPSEVLSSIFLHLSTPSFLQAVSTCHKLFDLASGSRDVLLHHLKNVPGIKLGLSDRSLKTVELFQILRQRASEHLFGANFHANCNDLRFQNGTLDAKASFLAESTDYFNISLALKESLTIRHYGYDCALKEHTFSPYADGRGKVLQVVHNKHTISVLYQWTPETRDGLEHGPIPLNLDPNQPQVTKHEDDEHARSRSRESSFSLDSSPDTTEYHLVHYKAYNLGPADFFRIPAPKSVSSDELIYRVPGHRVPVHLAVYNRLKCVIIWDTANVTTQSSSSPEIILYSTDKLPKHGEEGSYTSIMIFPLRPPHNWHKISHQTHGDALTYKKNKEHLSSYAPRAAAFHNGGHRISLYSPSSVVPYAVLYTNSSSYTSNTSASALGAAPRTLNEVLTHGHYYRIGPPFFGAHNFGPIPGDAEGVVGECTLTYLHLGHLYVDDQKNRQILCILQSRASMDSDDCRHLVNLDDMIRAPNTRTKVVARLWGWQADVTTMTALERIAISPKGTRIAISCWDRVFVWPLNPEVLCEDWVRADDNEDDISVLNDTDTPSDPPNNAQDDQANDSTSNDDNETGSDDGSRLGSKPRPLVVATGYYDLVKGGADFGFHVVLKPIVLKLPNGAIARRLTWGGSPRLQQETDDATEDVDDQIEEPQETRQESEPEASAVSTIIRNNGPQMNGDIARASPVLWSSGVLPLTPEETSTIDKATNISADGLKVVSDCLQVETSDAAKNFSSQAETMSLDDSTVSDDKSLDSSYAEVNSKVHPEVKEARHINTMDRPDHEGAYEEGNGADELPISTSSPITDPAYVDTTSNESNDDLIRSLSKLSLPDPPAHDPSAPIEIIEQASTSDPEGKGKEKEIPDTSRIPVELSLDDGTSLSSSIPTIVPVSIQPADQPADPQQTTSTQPTAKSKATDTETETTVKPKPRRRRKRKTEDELIVLTDRGVQLWDMGVWARGKRKRGWLDERLV